MASNYIELPPQSSSGVTTINSISGAVTLVAGTGISITPAGQNITIATTGGGTGTVTSVSVVSANGLAGTVATATTTPAITLSTTITGILQGNGTAISAATTGNLTDAGTDGIVITGGTGAVLGSGTSIAQHVADATHNGYLASTDFVTFNGKQAAGNYITALTGDATASGPGSVALTLATVNGNVGSFGSSTSIPSITVNAKGLITAASGNAVIAPAGTLSGTTLNATVVTSSLTSVGTITTGTWNSTIVMLISTVTSNTSAVSGRTYMADTSGGAFNITLPTPASGVFVAIKDSTGSFGTNNLTVVRNGSEMIEGVAASKVLQTNWGSSTFVSDGTNWFMI